MFIQQLPQVCGTFYTRLSSVHKLHWWRLRRYSVIVNCPPILNSSLVNIYMHQTNHLQYTGGKHYTIHLMQSFYVFYYLYFPYQTRAIFGKIAQILMLMCRIWSYDYKKKDKKIPKSPKLISPFPILREASSVKATTLYIPQLPLSWRFKIFGPKILIVFTLSSIFIQQPIQSAAMT